MILTKQLTTLEDFKALKEGDMVACEWHRDTFIGDKRTRFATYQVFKHLERTSEIVVQKKNNVYFNYSMFLNPEVDGYSNLKSIVLLQSV